MNKKEIRMAVLEKLQEVESQNPSIYKIQQNLFQLDEWKMANIIGVTISKSPELSTREIIEKAWEQGKTVVVPKCRPSDRSMTFYSITSFEQTERSFYGVLEPIPDRCKKIDWNEIELLLVPGLAFNSEGYRIGFGGGYYDRLLVHFTGPTVALAYEWQTTFDFKEEIHDKKVDQIITEKRSR